ncbi:MAG: DUF4287 domain-containing protein [Alphaproteobacteria bacterium]|nr:DUF4287 domain-containing protein [Alphaproteobacteria bacterium]
MSTPEEQTQTMIANMPAKTGKSLDEWLTIAAKAKLEKHGEIVKHLKAEHGLGHGFANLVAHYALGGGAAEGEDLIEAQYAGAKAALRPIYDAIAAYVQTLGPDVELSPKKTCVSFRRKKQFALAEPATKTRIDLGIQLKGAPAEGRLEAWGGMVSHKIRLESTKDFDASVKAWLKQAYEQA